MSSPHFYQRLAEAINEAYATQRLVTVELEKTARLMLYIPKYKTAMRITLDAPVGVSVETITVDLLRIWPRLQPERSLRVENGNRAQYSWSFIIHPQSELDPAWIEETKFESTALSNRARRLARAGQHAEAEKVRIQYDDYWKERDKVYFQTTYGGAYGNLLSDPAFGVDLGRLRRSARNSG